MNKTEKEEGVKHHGNVGRTALSKFKMWTLVDKQYRLLQGGQGSCTDDVVLQKRTRHEVLKVLSAWPNVKGWVLGGFGQGLHCRTGMEEVPGPSCLCFGKKAAFPLKGSWQWGQGRRVVLRAAHLCWESKVTAHSNCGDLPCPLHSLISLFLTTWKKSLFVVFFLACTGVGELIQYDRIATIAEKTGRMAHFFRDTLSCSMIYLACWSINAPCDAVTDFFDMEVLLGKAF